MLGQLGVGRKGALADLFQRLLAQDMLCLTGVLGGSLFVHAQLHKEVGQQTVTAIDTLCDLAARCQQGQVANQSGPAAAFSWQC